MLTTASDYDALITQFRWRIPEHYNIGVEACDRWAKTEPNRVAIIEALANGRTATLTYGDLRATSNRLANALRTRGIQALDRVAVLLPQGMAVPITHVAIYKLGAIAVPLAALFGIDALAYRLRDAGVKALVTNAAGLEKLSQIPSETLSSLDIVLSLDGAEGKAEGFDAVLSKESSDFEPVATFADDPAMMIYTSGTTGPPKGALHGHRVVPGHLPGVQMAQEFAPRPGDRLWTPADWAWAGGLLNVLMPGLVLGIPVVARKFEKFDPEEAFRLMAEQRIRNTFIAPTALRMLRGVADPRGRFDLSLRTITSGGEALGPETLAWGEEALGITINEFYGQTECNFVLASCGAIGVTRPGAIGRPVPGHDVAVIREDGTSCAVEELGQIAVRRPDPVMFLSYWNNEEATRTKFLGDWMTTGDQGVCDAEGYIRFVGRDDDVITSSGYRIGPGEIEDCLIGHPAVALAAVVGKPDLMRTQIVKAFVVLRAGSEPSEALASDIQTFVRRRLSAHEYPREIVFCQELPLTTTGKVIRRLLREQG